MLRQKSDDKQLAERVGRADLGKTSGIVWSFSLKDNELDPMPADSPTVSARFRLCSQDFIIASHGRPFGVLFHRVCRCCSPVDLPILS